MSWTRRSGSTQRNDHRVPAFALIHSPLVGPVTWSAVADELSRRQVGVVVPDLGAPVETETGRHWKRHVASAARAIASVPAAASVVLVGHSGAGALLPAIRDAMDRACAGYIFVDAGLPSSNEPRKGTGGFARHLDEIHAQGERFPDWSDEDLREALPVPAVRTALLRELRPQPPDCRSTASWVALPRSRRGPLPHACRPGRGERRAARDRGRDQTREAATRAAVMIAVARSSRVAFSASSAVSSS